ncbi:MAG: acetolactate synthase small subunit, partial [Pirellula sp.]
YVERDLMLIKVSAPTGTKRSEIRELAEIFRARIVDVGPEELMIEISGRENKVQAFVERMRPYGINELVRTVRIAMVRGSNPNICSDESNSALDQSVPNS